MELGTRGENTRPPRVNSRVLKLSKPNPNSTQLNAARADDRHNSHWEPTSPHPNTNFSATSRHARKLKFGVGTQ